MGLRDQALNLTALGYHVVPVSVVVEDDKKELYFPHGSWKFNASDNAVVVSAMPWGEATHIGLNCEASGVVVIDLDSFADEETRVEYEGTELLELYNGTVSQEAEDDAPASFSQSGKGIHIYYRASEPVGTSQGKLASWVDVRAEGGFIIVGQPEELKAVTELPPVPAWVVEASKPADKPTERAEPRDPRYGRGEDGTRWGLAGLRSELDSITRAWDDYESFNETLNLCAFRVGQLVTGGELDESHAEQTLRDLLAELGAPANQYKTLASGFTSGMDYPRYPEGEVTEEEQEKLWDEFLDHEGISNLPPPTWLLPGWLEKNSLARMIGEPGSGKSFVGLDWAACVSRGMAWPGRGDANYKPELVVYVAAEGAHGLGSRMRAWTYVHGAPGSLRFLPDALQIHGRSNREMARWETFVELMKTKKPGLIIFDTQARVTVGVEENSASEMGQVIDRLEKLREVTGSCVLLIHHTSKMPGGGARGSSAMLGAVSTEIVVKPRAQQTIMVEVVKQKNAPPTDAMYLKIEDALPGSATLVSVNKPEPRNADVTRQHNTMLIRQAMTVDTATQLWRRSELELATGLSTGVIHPLLESLAREGKITKTQLPGKGAPVGYVWTEQAEG